MKLAKKVLACVIAVALISTLAISAFAAAPAFSVNAPKSVQVGDNVTVTVAITDAKGLMNIGAGLTYDTDKLEVVSVTGGKNDDGNFTAGSPATGEVTFGIALAESATVDTLNAVTIVFTAKETGNATISIAQPDDIDGIDAPAAVDVNVNITERTTAAPGGSQTPGSSNNASDPSTTKAANDTPKTGDAGIAVAAGLVVLAGAAFVASKKTK